MHRNLVWLRQQGNRRDIVEKWRGSVVGHLGEVTTWAKYNRWVLADTHWQASYERTLPSYGNLKWDQLAGASLRHTIPCSAYSFLDTPYLQRRQNKVKNTEGLNLHLVYKFLPASWLRPRVYVTFTAKLCHQYIADSNPTDFGLRNRCISLCMKQTHKKHNNQFLCWWIATMP